MTNVELTKLVEQQQKQINHLKGRLSDLRDEIFSLNGAVDTFKVQVSKDLRTLLEIKKN